MLDALLKPIVGTALSWYYRSVSVAGKRRIPMRGPVFLAVNHPNALVDALIVGCIAPRRVRFTAKATLFSNPVSAAFLNAAGVVPLRRASDEGPRTTDGTAAADPARNADAFRAVATALAQESAIVIFPEGKSHDEPQLAPLRTGLARMTLLARDTFGVRGIHIVPVGLFFEQKEEPRSRVLVQVGEAIDVDAFRSSDHAVEALTALVAERLTAVTVNFESEHDQARVAPIIETLAALLEPLNTIDHEGHSLVTLLSLMRRADRVNRALKSESASRVLERVQLFEERLARFRAHLEREHLVVADLAIDLDATSGFRFALRETVLAALPLPVSWWGRLTHFVPIRLARWLALRNAHHRDEPAMNTLLFGLVLVLASYTLETIAVWRVFGTWWALAFFVTLIPSASNDIRYGDRARRRTQRARAYFTFRRAPALQASLLAEADWLRREAGAIEQLV